jgi:hypothetical protein
MNGYSIVLFVHIVVVLGIFIALGLEWTALLQIRGARTIEPVYAWMRILNSTRKFGFISMLATVLSGLYMMAAVWGWVAWINVSIGSLVLVILLSLVLSAPRMKMVGRALAAEKGPVSLTFRSLADHPLLWISIQTRAAIALGIILLKIAKPDISGSFLIIGAAIALGLVSALPIPRHASVEKRPAD